jgi:glycosyltransferase involved in cell wall biosynthesis
MSEKVKKKILFVDQSLDSGGAERVMCTIIRSLDPNYFDISLVLVSSAGSLIKLIPDHVKVYILGVSKTRHAAWKFGLLLRKCKPNVIFATTERSIVLSIIGSFFLLRKCKLIARFPNTISKQKNAGLQVGWRYVAIKFGIRLCDVVISQTELMSTDLINFMGVHKEKIKIIRNPVDTEYITSQVSNVKSPFDSDYINIVASGRITKQKGFDDLINAFSLVVDKNKKYRLHILGEDKDNLTSSLNRQAVTYGIQDYITFYGQVDNPFVFYKYCDLFVLSSRWEGLPNVVLECKFLGKPVVSTKCVPELESILNDGVSDYLVDVGDYKAMADKILCHRDLTQVSKYDNGISNIATIFN